MNQLLKNLWRSLTGRGRLLRSGSPARTARPQVEQLEERAVPTANIANHYFPGPGWTLYVTQETFVQGGATFVGVFADTTPGPYHGVNVPVSGAIYNGNYGWDYFQLSGTGTTEATYDGIPLWEHKETINFSGYLNQPGTQMDVTNWYQTYSVWTLTSGWQWKWSLYGNTNDFYEVAGYGYSF
jgi:hypothetical protein